MTRSTVRTPLTISAFVAMFAATAILEIGLIKLGYAQVTAGQNPMCDPSDTHINGTESRACGVPKTPSSSSSLSSSSAVANSTTTSAAVTTTAQPSQNMTSPQGAIPGLLP